MNILCLDGDKECMWGAIGSRILLWWVARRFSCVGFRILWIVKNVGHFIAYRNRGMGWPALPINIEEFHLLNFSDLIDVWRVETMVWLCFIGNTQRNIDLRLVFLCTKKWSRNLSLLHEIEIEFTFWKIADTNVSGDPWWIKSFKMLKLHTILSVSLHGNIHSLQTSQINRIQFEASPLLL